MKRPPSLVISTLALLALALSSPAQNATPDFDPLGEHDNLPRQIRIQVEFIEVTHEMFSDLTLGKKTSANDAELRKTLGELVKKGEAKIVETMMCVARSGQKATTESIREFIYPTEYEPAETPNKVVTEKDGEKTEAPAPDLAHGPTPTAFETRNLGSTLSSIMSAMRSGRSGTTTMATPPSACPPCIRSGSTPPSPWWPASLTWSPHSRRRTTRASRTIPASGWPS